MGSDSPQQLTPSRCSAVFDDHQQKPDGPGQEENLPTLVSGGVSVDRLHGRDWDRFTREVAGLEMSALRVSSWASADIQNYYVVELKKILTQLPWEPLQKPGASENPGRK